MVANFILQGIDKNYNHYEKLSDMFDEYGIEKILISTAFLRKSGVSQIQSDIEYTKKKTKCYIGIRNGITSKQGLIELLAIGVEVYVVDTGTSNYIFHPKVYVVDCNEKAFVLTGSANLTIGGLLKNIEASTLIELDCWKEKDKHYLEEVYESFDLLEGMYPENVYKIFCEDDVEELFDKGLVVDELKDIKIRNFLKNRSDNVDVTPIMKLRVGKVNQNRQYENSKFMVIYSDGDISGDKFEEVWKSKELTERDLNIPTGDNTNSTGSMTLKKGEYRDIDQRDYFRYEIFDKLIWESNNSKKPYLEYCEIEMRIVIEGVDFGLFQLKLKHDTRTDTASYTQNNAMTHLLWKDAKKIIKDKNLLGKKLKILKNISDETEFIIIID